MLISSAIPLIITNTSSESEDVQAVAQSAVSATTTAETTAKPDNTISVFSHNDKSVTEVDITDYVCGCLAAEMPLSFHDEALKAQAVACYSFALWIKNNADNPKSELADVTDSPDTHQAYLNESQLKEKWGNEFPQNYKKIKKIVSSVSGQYLAFDNEPIMAVYHSLSPGKTQSAENVWGNDIPYLRSTTAPGDKLSPEYQSSVTLDLNQIKQAVQKNKSYKFNLKANPIGEIKETDSGYVESAEIYSVVMNPKELRALFGLKSPFFSLKKTDNSVTFTVYGYGHGVGMSQYSADYMARQGSDYKEILNHFYKGATLSE